MTPPNTEPSIVTFYAYKGGTGRTMALANSACLAARRMSGGTTRVLVMDWDLEAPGLHKFFPGAESSGNSRRRGVIEYFAELSRLLKDQDDLGAKLRQPEAHLTLGQALPLDPFLVPDVVPGVDMIRAGALDEEYVDLLGSFSWVGLFQSFPFAFSAFRALLTSRYQLVFIDSRTGLTDTGGICTSIFPDKLVAVFTPNEQSLTGLISVVRQAVGWRRSTDDFRSLAVYPLPSRVEVHAEQELRKQWRARYQSGFEKLFGEIYSLPDCQLGLYFDEVEIPHVPYYLFGERIAVNEPGEDALSLKKAYERFFDQLTLWESAWEQTESAGAAAERIPPVPEVIPAPIEAPARLEPSAGALPSAAAALVETIAREFVEGRIFPFLGYGVNVAGRPQGASWNESAPDLPTAAELARYLAAASKSAEVESQDLARVSQFVALAQGQRALYDLLSRAFREPRLPSAVHQFLAALDPSGRSAGLNLIVTTTFDRSIEQALVKAGREFEVLSYLAEGEGRGHFSHQPYAGEPHIIDRPNTYMDVGRDGRPVVLRLFGQFDPRSSAPPSFAITEDHMLAYADGRNLRYVLPPPVVIKLEEAVPLFLGCSLSDGLLRLVLSRFPSWATRHRGWAVSARVSEYEYSLWRARGITVIADTLDAFLARFGELTASISRAEGRL